MTRVPDPRVVPFLTVKEAGAFLGMGRSKSYDMAHQFEVSGGATGLPCVRMGRSLVVPVARLRALAGMPPYDPDELADRGAT